MTQKQWKFLYCCNPYVVLYQIEKQSTHCKVGRLLQKDTYHDSD